MSGAEPPARPAEGGDDPDRREAETSADRSKKRTGSRRRRVLGVLGLLVLALAVWTVINGLVAAHRLRAVRADVAAITSHPGDDRAALERRIERDLQTVRSADGLLHQLGPRIASAVPILGRNVSSAQDVADASEAALQAGLTISRSTADLGNGNGGVNLTRLEAAADELRSAAATLRAPLAALARSKTGWTLPPVVSGVRDARDELLGLDGRLDRGAAALDGVAGILGGSGRRTILVGLMNNAELRGTGGLVSTFALGHTENGQLSLGQFHDVNEVSESSGFARTVPAPPDYVAAYGPYLANTTLWKNVTMSPRGDESAAVLARIAKVSLGTQPDVVLLCDVPAAAAIVSATGPVTIDGEEVTGEQLTQRLLVDAYGEAKLSHAENERRRKVLAQAASQAFDRLRQDATATPALLQALADAAAGRHIVLWSARPDEEAKLRTADVAGTIDPAGGDVAMPFTNNLGDRPNLGNKLDYYVDRSLTVEAKLSTKSATVVQTLTLRNNAPTGLGPYVAGVAHPGEVSELLSLYVGAQAQLAGFQRDGHDASVDVVREEGLQRLTTTFQLPRGASTTFRLSYELPLTNGVYRLALLPQPLARPAHLHLHIDANDGVLGVAEGVEQPNGGDIEVNADWTASRRITVPVHGYTGFRGLGHSIAHFWTHKVSW